MRVKDFLLSSLPLLIGNVASYQMKNERFPHHRDVRDVNHSIVRSTSSPTDRRPNLHDRSSVVKEGRHHRSREAVKKENRRQNDRVPRRRNIETGSIPTDASSSSASHHIESKHKKSVCIESSKRKAFTYYHMNGLHLR